MMMLIVYHTELTGSHSVDGFFGMHHETSISLSLDDGRMILWGMTYLERDAMHIHLASKEVKIVQRKIFLIGCLRIVTMAHIQDVVLHIFLDHKPRTATKAKSLALTDGVIPQPLVRTDALPCLQLYDIARIVAQIAAYVFIVIDLS